MKAFFRAFACAWTLLTRIPLPFVVRDMDAQARRSVAFFPVCALLVGGAGALCYWLISLRASTWVCAIICVIAQVAMTGALHVDGLADCADALYLKRDRQSTLNIMRDSRVGAYGAVAICIDIAVKVVLLAELGNKGLMTACLTALLLPVAGKLGSAALILLGANAQNDGLGAAFLKNPSRAACVVALALSLAMLWGGLRYLGIIAGVAGALCATLWGWRIKRRIGGFTGDVLGAANEITEMVYLLILTLV